MIWVSLRCLLGQMPICGILDKLELGRAATSPKGDRMFIRVGAGECAILIIVLLIVVVSVALSVRMRRDT